MAKINVLDFDEFPGLRHFSISENSGEDYYHQVLNKAFVEAYKKGETLEVDLDGTDAYASSFLDEAFGNLVYDFQLKNVKPLVRIISKEEPHWIKMIEEKTYNQWEERRKKNDKVVVTREHDPWFRLIDDELILQIWELP